MELIICQKEKTNIWKIATVRVDFQLKCNYVERVERLITKRNDPKGIDHTDGRER